MVGYDTYSTGYLVWYPGSRRLEKARDIFFHEEAITPAKPVLYGDDSPLAKSDEKSAVPLPSAAITQAPSVENTRLTIRIPPRPKQPPSEENEPSRLVSSVPDFPRGTTRSGKVRDEGMINMVLAEESEDDLPGAFSVTSKDPTITEALSMPGAEGRAWEAARQAEWENMVKFDVFSAPAEPPPGTKVLKTGTVCRGTYRDGKIVKRKVRIVVKGYSQIPGIHFTETYAPVMKWSTFRMILTIGASMNATIRQFDVKSAYLHGTMKEEVWVQQPEGFEVPGKEHLPLRLQKALYGTKQGGHEWHLTLLHFMLHELGWDASGYDRATYSKSWDDGTWALVGFWVDDATVVGSEERVQELEKAFEERFGISGSGDAHWILGTSIRRDANVLYVYISQEDYIHSVAKKFNVHNARPIYSPLPLGVDFGAISRPETEDEKSEAAKLPYKELIGSLMFAATVSRPDIAFSVNKLAQYSSNPGQAHWTLAKRVLQYLNTTRDRELRLGGERMRLCAYSDADYAGDTEDRKSTGGYAVFLGEGAVSWSSKKQTLVALSSTESEYVALSEAAREVLWVRRFLEDSMELVFDEPTVIFEDNQSAIAFAQNQRIVGRTKHIHVKYHFVRDLIENYTIKLVYRNTKLMTADILTKTLPPASHAHHSERLGIYPPRLVGESWRDRALRVRARGDGEVGDVDIEDGRVGDGDRDDARRIGDEGAGTSQD
jgi:hypothetical protein